MIEQCQTRLWDGHSNKTQCVLEKSHKGMCDFTDTYSLTVKTSAHYSGVVEDYANRVAEASKAGVTFQFAKISTFKQMLADYQELERQLRKKGNDNPIDIEVVV